MEPRHYFVIGLIVLGLIFLIFAIKQKINTERLNAIAAFASVVSMIAAVAVFLIAPAPTPSDPAIHTPDPKLQPFPYGEFEISIPPLAEPSSPLVVTAIRSPIMIGDERHRFLDIYLQNPTQQAIALVGVSCESVIPSIVLVSAYMGHPLKPETFYEIQYKEDSVGRSPLSPVFMIPPQGVATIRLYLTPTSATATTEANEGAGQKGGQASLAVAESRNERSRGITSPSMKVHLVDQSGRFIAVINDFERK